MLFIIIIGVSLLGMYAQSQLRGKFKKYSQIPVKSGLSGAEVAQAMLHDYGVTDVQIVPGKGLLTDHYNPLTKIIQLSPEVYHGRSVAAAAVAAHECGHAVQHATSYSMLKLRSALVPVVKVASIAQQWGLLAAIFLLGSFPQLLLVVIIAFAITTLFAVITLPVEFDASRRALVWLDDSGLAQGDEYDGAKDALKWAAMTYVVGALSSFAMLIYLVSAYMSRN